ncbi:uncharacterized protein [Amphiura filiformis]|uniref:uncharacterized protein n=1 Tax=Amphiura filiformis TaxID=82378 RepID=UPI003B223F20
MGGQLDLTRLDEEQFYSRTLVNFNESQEQDIFNSCNGAIFFRPRSEFEQTRRKRQASNATSRVCPADPPKPAILVTLTGDNLAQVAHLNRQVQGNVFNEECTYSTCLIDGCTCDKVFRTVTAYLMVIPLSGIPDAVTLENVQIHSCAALI